MPNRTELATYARQLTVQVIGEIREDQQERGKIRPAVGSGNERGGGAEADEQAQSGQLIRCNRAVLERRNQPARELRVPWTLCSGESRLFSLGHIRRL